MKKYVIGFVLVVIAVAGWLVYKAETVDYTQIVANEVDHFESELKQDDILIEQGKLTQGIATVARVRLITQLDVIWDTIELAEVTHVSKEQEFLLLKGLEQLERIIVDHEDTIDTVEKTASAHFAEGDPALDTIVERIHDLTELLNDHIREVVPHANSPNQSDTQASPDISNQNLSVVPESVFSETNRTQLDLSHNQLTGSLPAEVRLLSKLQTLNLSHNQFTGVPAEIGQLSELKVLNLSHNQLTGLPHELGNLQNLVTLDLRGNNYSTYDLDIITERLPDTTDILID